MKKRLVLPAAFLFATALAACGQVPTPGAALTEPASDLVPAGRVILEADETAGRVDALATSEPVSFTNGAGRVGDSAATNGLTVLLPQTGSSVRFTVPSNLGNGTYTVRIMARGINDGGNPVVRLNLNGNQVATNEIETSNYATHTFGNYSLAAGQTLEIQHTNGPTSGSGTNRDPRVDYMILDPVSTTSPAPSPTEPAPAPSEPTPPSTNLIGNWYVDDNANGTGTSSNPFRTIQQAVNAASSGQTIVVRAGTYRESVNLDKSLTLLGEPGATIKGSDVWNTGWTQSGSYFTRSYSVSLPAIDGSCKSNSNGRCKSAAQVFLNGVPQRQEMSLSAVGSGDFWIGNSKIYLGTNPSGRQVEVTTRQYWVSDANYRGLSGVTVRGFTMTHAASAAQRGGLDTTNGSNWKIENNDLSYAHGYNLRLGGSGHVVRNNKIRYAGDTGIAGGPFSNVRIENNEIAYNNTEEFNWDWEGGGLKFGGVKNVVIASNYVHDNDGTGMWCDMACDGVQFLNNRASNNQRTGIQYEISYNCLVADNISYENGRGKPEWVWGGGILIQNSSGCTVRNNTVAWNADGISVIEQNRGDNYKVYNTKVHDNVIITKNASEQLSWSSDWSSGSLFTAGNNNGWNNKYYWDPNATRAWGWKGGISDLASFNNTPGEDNGQAINKTTADTIMTAKNIPLWPSR